MDLNSITSFIQLLSSFLVSLTALAGVVIGIIRPIRRWFVGLFRSYSNKDIDDKISKIEAFVESVKEELKTKFERDQHEQKLIKEATVASTRNFLTEIYNKAAERGYIGDWDRENFERMYKVYDEMGGNSYIHEVHDRIISMPRTPKAKRVSHKKK